MIGRNDSEWGQIGAMTIAGTFGWTIEAPADAAYAVLPVGVEIIKPATAANSIQPTINTSRKICKGLIKKE